MNLTKSPDSAKPASATVSKAKASASEPLISLAHVDKQFQTDGGLVDALKNINFETPKGSFTIIFGPSGSGKTTLMNVLSGLEPATRGAVRIAGQDVYDLTADERAHFRARTMGIVHQSNYWVSSLSVLENVAMPLYLSGASRESARKLAKDSLERVGMAKFAKSRPTVLSGGQQQRVSMARALVGGSELILADEPTGNLDSSNGQMIIDLLLACRKDLGCTIVLVTHNIEYLPLSDQQLFIHDGELTVSRRGEKMPEHILASLRAQISELTKMERG